jgi:hypothetical protein
MFHFISYALHSILSTGEEPMILVPNFFCYLGTEVKSWRESVSTLCRQNPQGKKEILGTRENESMRSAPHFFEKIMGDLIFLPVAKRFLPHHKVSLFFCWPRADPESTFLFNSIITVGNLWSRSVLFQPEPK